MDKLWRSNSSVSSRMTSCPPDIVNEEDHTVEENEILDFRNWNIPKIGLVQVVVKPLTKKAINASILMCLRDARFKRFKRFNDSILGMIIASLYDGLVYFDCYPDITLALDDVNIVKALTLNILTSGYDMEEGSKPFALITNFWVLN
ncbi:hypothetical protein SO802_022876 [Lithocarpus litseifolius]|uniref:Uncharacterized protein n=1 Tax=Lithocarpus litseifolius TaxID=425828 RepID=A0AAW2C5F6_9ROSI